MKVVWLTRDEETLGGIGTSWYQSWGVSRDERSGRWTVWDRRDDGETRGTSYLYFEDILAMLGYFEMDEPGGLEVITDALMRLPLRERRLIGEALEGSTTEQRREAERASE